MSNRISRLVLRHFRGATVPAELAFDTSMPMLMIFGENGAGKSTIVDAIDMVCNQWIGSLAERSSVQIRHHLASLGRGLSDVRVELSIGDKTWEATHPTKGVVVAGPDERPSVSILRRSQMLRLIEAQPAKRYEELQRFIDVAGVEQSEERLRSAVKEADKRLDTALSTKVSADAGIEKLWIAEGKQDASPIVWAKDKAQADPAQIQSKISQFGELISALESAAEARLAREEAHELSLSRKQNWDALDRKREEVERQSETGSVQLIKLLQEAQKYLAGNAKIGACPVCEKPLDTSQLQTGLSARLVEMETLRVLQSELETARSQHSQAVIASDRANKQWLAAARKLMVCLQTSSLSGAQRLGLDWANYAELQGDSETTEAHQQAEALLKKLLPYREKLAEKKLALETDLKQLNAIRILYQQVTEAETSSHEAFVLVERLKQALEIVHKARLEFTDAILKEVSEECNSLYAKIHPDEPIGQLALSLNQSTKGSLLQGANFGTHTNVPPQAYYSEAHLDTLGFCLFLALAKRTPPGEGLVVLDDVFTSVDTDHLERIADLLVECVEQNAFAQIILTTHSHAWREQFSHNRAVSKHCHLIELLPWNFEHGVRAHKTKLTV